MSDRYWAMLLMGSWLCTLIGVIWTLEWIDAGEDPLTRFARVYYKFHRGTPPPIIDPDPKNPNLVGLYRVWGKDSQRPLYIGISHHPLARFSQHAEEKPWWRGQVWNTEVDWYPSREAAALAEKQAIRNERPIHNVTHNDTGARRQTAKRR